MTEPTREKYLVDVVRAWKDESYRSSLPAAIREQIPAPPGNLSQLSDEQLIEAAGGVLGAAVAIGGGATLGAIGGIGAAAAAGLHHTNAKLSHDIYQKGIIVPPDAP